MHVKTQYSSPLKPRRNGSTRAGLFLATLLLATATMAENSHREEAKQQLALRAAAREVLDNLNKLTEISAADAALLTDELKRQMLNNVTPHQALKQSLALSRERVKNSRDARALDLIDQATVRANELSPLPVTRDEVIERMGPEWTKQKDDAVNRFVTDHFEQIFADARCAATMAQKAEIERSVQYPTFEALDAKLTELAPSPEKARTPLDRNAFNQLQPWVQSVALADATVFEENQPVVRKLGDNVLLEIQAQYDKQIAVVRDLLGKQGIPDDLIVRGLIEDFLLRTLTDTLASVKPGAAPTYPSFTAVKNYAAWQAQQLELQRLLAFLARPESIRIDRADVERRITAEPALHREPAASHKTLAAMYATELRRPLAERYAARSKTAVTNQVDLLLLNNQEVSKAFAGRIDAMLKEASPPARAAIAQRQFEATFPALLANKPFTEPMIEFLHDEQTPTIENMALLTQFLNLDPDLAPRQHNPGDLLAETRTLALDAANAQAGPLVRALGAQLRLVAELEKEKADQLRADVMDGTSYDAIKKEWHTELEQRWKKQAGDGDAPGRKLFARTESQLDKTVRQLFDAVKAELTAEQTPAQTAEGIKNATPESQNVEVPEEKKEEEEQPTEEKLAGMEEELLTCKGIADFVLVFSDGPKDSGLAVFGTPADGAVTRTEFSPLEIEAAADKIAQAVQEHFTQLLRAKAESAHTPLLLFWKKRSPLIRVLVLEHSRQTRHITSIILQRKIKDQIRGLTGMGKIRFELDWQESLGIDD